MVFGRCRPERLLPPTLEQEYRATCWRQDTYAAMLCLAVCTIFYSLSLWYDAIIFSLHDSGAFTVSFSVISLVFTLRIVSVLYALAFGVWLYKHRNLPRFAVYDALFFIWLLLNAPLILLSEITRPAWYYIGSVSHIAIVMMLYLVLPQHNTFLRALPPLLFTAGYFIVYAEFKQPLPLLGFSTIYLGFILVNALGIVVSHMTHTLKRRQFALDQEKDRLVTLLAEGKEALEQKNRELEQEKELVACYEAELRRREVRREKMRTLQAQIKPHFLYNTLSTIAYYCRNRPEQAYALIGDLSIYLQGAFKLQDGQIAMENELELVRAYLAIEAARMEDRLKTEFEVAGDFSSCCLPPFTLQPLVENAVRHGLSRLPGGGSVKVIAREEADRYCFAVIDNGAGIAPEKLAKLLCPHEKDDDSGIGLANVHERLLDLYGSGLDIVSDLGRGTSASFSIPREYRET